MKKPIQSLLHLQKKKKNIWNLSNLQLNNSIHFTRPGNEREALKLNKADYYSKVKAILSETYKFSLLHNGANQHSWLWNYYMLSTELPKIPLPTSYFSPLTGFNLLLWIKIIWSSCMGYQTFTNRILLSYIFLKTHSCNLVKILT